MARLSSEIVVGVMSGTSTDGIDLAACRFRKINNHYDFELLATSFFEYDEVWKKKLNNLRQFSAETLFETDVELGKLIAQHVLNFQNEHDFNAGLIASHGHTVFHNPSLGFSVQIGCGATIAAQTGISTVNNFRQLDVALGGQGAPLVPIGDRYLFSDYDACLNIGGFANISFELEEKRIAFDISPTNRVLNKWSQDLGFDYDKNGELGQKGQVINSLLSTWNNVTYYQSNGPKSLSEEWLISQFYPLINSNWKTEDLMATAYVHIGYQIGSVLSKYKLKNCLITGGGAYNTYLIDQIKKSAPDCDLVLPEKKIIDFKESIIFAFLGWLRINKLPNTLIEATGASKNCLSGIIWEV